MTHGFQVQQRARDFSAAGIRAEGTSGRMVLERRQGFAPMGKRLEIAAQMLVLVSIVQVAGAADLNPDAGQIALGRRIYREGALGAGQPLVARVQDDVTLKAGSAACVNCHQRSGMGTTEGQTLVRPISAPALAQPTTDSRQRPAYSDATLIRAIRDGVDSAGQPLNRLMPRYALPDDAATSLVAYLKTLSAQQSPGVSQEAIHFATVVTDAVPRARRKAMLDILEAYFREANAGRGLAGGRSFGPSRTRSAAGGTRAWRLHRWTLSGVPASWPTQLDAYYREQPVFAVLSGVGADEWRPVHEFCERNEVPCLLPNARLPVLAPTDFYTLYFSRGLALEAEVLAADLKRNSSGVKVLQVYRRDPAGLTAAGALRSALASSGGATVSDWILEDSETLDAKALAEKLNATSSNAAVLWLPREILATLGEEHWTASEPVRLYLSSTLLNGELAAVPVPIRRFSAVIHPFAQQKIRRLDNWLARHGLAVTDPTVQAQTYFACLIASEGLKRAGERLHGNYFLEVIDRLAMAPMGSGFPSPEFAPNRRYLINGAFVVEVGDGDKAPIKNPHWVIP